jgi:hypothetical protein
MDKALEDEVNEHIRINDIILRNEYYLTEKQIDVMYANTERVLDVLMNHFDASPMNHDGIGNAWRCITSQYFADVVHMYDKYEGYIIGPLTHEQTYKYANRILKMCGEKNG